MSRRVEIKVKVVNLIFGNESKGQCPDVRQIRAGVVGLEGLHGHISHRDAQSVRDPGWEEVEYLLLGDLAVDHESVIQGLQETDLDACCILRLLRHATRGLDQRRY